MSGRNIFVELTEGFEALIAEREGEITLRKVQVTRKSPPQISQADVLALRENSTSHAPRLPTIGAADCPD